MLCKRQYGPLLAAIILLSIGAACSQESQPLRLATPPPPVPPTSTATPAGNKTVTVSPIPASPTGQAEAAGTTMRILLVHYRGSLQPLGCCNQGLYERDEFVAIQNTSNVPQNVAGWKLVNLTRGYPSYTFPAYFPCLPYTRSTETQNASNAQYGTNAPQNYAAHPPQAVERIFNTTQTVPEPVTSSPLAIDWASCVPNAPLDETPMTPMGDQQQGRQVPCMLYPGQILLVFTDEIHCQYGGLTFRYGQGNIWNNEVPNTAVLYDSQGNEVSRKSYTLGRKPPQVRRRQQNLLIYLIPVYIIRKTQ
jgi:hypothetical protein